MQLVSQVLVYNDFLSHLYIFTLNTVEVHQELFLVNKVSECQRCVSVCVSLMMLIIGGCGEDIDDDDDIDEDEDEDDEDNCHSKSLGWISLIRDYLQDIYN